MREAGQGPGPEWPSDRAITLRDEVEFIEPVLRALDMPVLYMKGGRSTRAAHGVARLLTAALPNVEVLEFEKLGHMGPITHPQVVNEAIERFLDRV